MIKKFVLRLIRLSQTKAEKTDLYFISIFISLRMTDVLKVGQCK